jgi:hypothetical protein
MKRIGFVLLLSVGVAGLGCTPPSFLRNDPPPPRVEIKPPPAPPIVTPDSVNEKNAAERARSLREELEYDKTQKTATTETKGS